MSAELSQHTVWQTANQWHRELLERQKEELNKEFIRRWVDALRSGAYLQGIGYLAAKNQATGQWLHCCLGVACELAVEDGLIGSALGARDASTERTVKTYGDFGLPVGEGVALSNQVLPTAVAAHIGVNQNNPLLLIPGGGVLSAAGMNDSERTFSEIADAIERTFLTGEEPEAKEDSHDPQ